MKIVYLSLITTMTFITVGCNEPELLPPKITSVKLNQQIFEVCFDRTLVFEDEYVLNFFFETKTDRQFTGKTAVKGDNQKNCKSINTLSLIDPSMRVSEEERTELIEHHIVQGNINSVDISVNKIPIKLSSVKFFDL